jgi:hypothetical protein
MNLSRVLLYLIIIISTVFFYVSCKKEYIEIESYSTDYFPLDSGKYSIYEAKYFLYNDFDRTVDTSTYYLKEVITRIELDNNGKPYYRLERFVSQDRFASYWQFVEVWAAQIIDNKAYRIENNQRFINITFPAKKNKPWNGLAYIRKDTTIAIPGGTIDVYKDWEDFVITSIDSTETIAGITYDSVLTIKRVDKTNNIERRYSFEKYAKNIGLISKVDSILDTQCNGSISSCINLPWGVKAEKGYILELKLVETNW